MDATCGVSLRETILEQLNQFRHTQLPIPREFYDAYLTAQELVLDGVVKVTHRDEMTLYLTLAA